MDTSLMAMKHVCFLLLDKMKLKCSMGRGEIRFSWRSAIGKKLYKNPGINLPLLADKFMTNHEGAAATGRATKQVLPII